MKHEQRGIEKYDDDAGFESHSYMMNLLSTKAGLWKISFVLFLEN